MISFCANFAFAQQSCQNSCSYECVMVAQDILRRCGGDTPTPPTQPPQPLRTELYHSDYCNEGDLIANLKSTTNCTDSAMTSAPKTWGVKVRGICYNISDVESSRACVLFKAASNGYATLFYHSDSCQQSELIAAVDESTDCEKLAQAENDRVWGVMVDGRCINISDADMKVACERYKDSFVVEKNRAGQSK